MTRTVDDLLVPAGTGEGDDPVLITPARARWRYCGLRVLRLAPGVPRRLALGEDEAALVPLALPSLDVEVDGARHHLRGRADAFARVPDYLYVPRDSELEVVSAEGGTLAVATAHARTRREAVLLRAEDVAIEVRGAGRASRQVTNFLTPDVHVADRLLCCEVLTPPGNWSSHPPHKHDDATGGVEAARGDLLLPGRRRRRRLRRAPHLRPRGGLGRDGDGAHG